MATPLQIVVPSRSEMFVLTKTICAPFIGHGHDRFRPRTDISTPLFWRGFQPLIGDVASKRIPVKIKASKLADSLSSTITAPDKRIGEEEEESPQDLNKKVANNTLADRWREIHGQSDWEGMLEPIDPLLGTELIRYGEMAQSCYDAFDFDPYSKYCGSCRFRRREFFDCLGMLDSGYEVTRYLYATSNINLQNFVKKSRWPQMWSASANWIGYVAVSSDDTSKRLGRRDIAISWRGTVTNLEWVEDLMDFLKPASSVGIPAPDWRVKVESGFLDLYTDKDKTCRFCKYSAREQILAEVKRLLEQSDEVHSITITGHSLGGALAVLSAYDIAETGLNVLPDGRVVPITVFSFSGPRVGNPRFKERFEELGIKALRVVNVNDTVPKVPGALFNERVPMFMQKLAEGLPWCYSHVGVELAIDHRVSPFLKEISDPACYHNLEALLHLLDGYRGKGKKFEPAARDPALVNKSSNFLKEHHLVPPHWRQDENKGLVRTTDGKWILPERQKIDDHPPEAHAHLEQIQAITGG